MNLNLRIVNLLNLVVLGNVKCGINVYDCVGMIQRPHRSL
jgi:hypothetical protein